MNTQGPLMRVEISHDGMDVYPAALRPNIKFRYGWLNGGKIQQVGPVDFSYGWSGGIRQIGNLTVHYGWNGNISEITGKDSRVEVILYTRSQARPQENHEARRTNQS